MTSKRSSAAGRKLQNKSSSPPSLTNARTSRLPVHDPARPSTLSLAKASCWVSSAVRRYTNRQEHSSCSCCATVAGVQHVFFIFEFCVVELLCSPSDSFHSLQRYYHQDGNRARRTGHLPRFCSSTFLQIRTITGRQDCRVRMLTAVRVFVFPFMC